MAVPAAAAAAAAVGDALTEYWREGVGTCEPFRSNPPWFSSGQLTANLPIIRCEETSAGVSGGEVWKHQAWSLTHHVYPLHQVSITGLPVVPTSLNNRSDCTPTSLNNRPDCTPTGLNNRSDCTPTGLNNRPDCGSISLNMRFMTGPTSLNTVLVVVQCLDNRTVAPPLH